VQEAGVADRDEAQDFKRRARRRLIGAIALVLFLVIVPPWIMEREPKPSVSGLNVEIPSQEAKRPPPKVAPPGAARPEPPVPAEKTAKLEERTAPLADSSRTTVDPPQAEVAPPASEASGRNDKPAEKPGRAAEPATTSPAKPAPKDAAKKSDAERAEALLAGAPTVSYIVPVGTYANGEGVKQVQAKLSGLGVKSYTEAAGNGQTRVRAGPYASRELAEKARGKLAGAGLKPGAVVARK
jgi:DedD protein